MPGATVGEIQAAQGSHLAAKGEEVRSKILGFGATRIHGAPRKGTLEGRQGVAPQLSQPCSFWPGWI